MSYHSNKYKPINKMLLKMAFDDNIHDINKDIESHKIISEGTMRFFNPLCPTLLEDNVYNLKITNRMLKSRIIINTIYKKLTFKDKSVDKNFFMLKCNEKLTQKNFMFYTFMEYIKGETLNKYTQNIFFHLTGKDRYVINLQRYLAIELAMIGYTQNDNQESNYMIYDHSARHTNTRRIAGGNGSSKTRRISSGNSSPSTNVFRDVESEEARENVRKHFVKHGKKSSRQKELSIVVIDLNGVIPYTNDIIIDWSIDSIKSNYFSVQSLFKGATTFTERDAEVIQNIKKNITIKEIEAERGKYIYKMEWLDNPKSIEVYKKYYESFLAGRRLLDTRDVISLEHISSPHR
jgi:hypothetical protein